MAMAEYHRQWLLPGKPLGHWTHFNPLGFARLLVSKRAQTGSVTRIQHPKVSYVRGRHMHYTKTSMAILDQSNIDGELAIARNKLFGAIERINQPIPIPQLALGKLWNSALFRDNRQGQQSG